MSARRRHPVLERRFPSRAEPDCRGNTDFAATDSPLTSAQRQACPQCVQIPWTVTAIGIGCHVTGVGNKLQLSPSVLAQIYLGQITKWNDARITALLESVNGAIGYAGAAYLGDLGRRHGAHGQTSDGA